MTPDELLRLARTVRHLRPAQIAHRLRLSARRALWTRLGDRIERRYRARARGASPPRLDHPGLRRVAERRLAARARGAGERAADVLAGRFTFLNQTRDLGFPPDWYRADLDVGTRLWKTHLHEFSFALDLAAGERAAGDGRHRAAFVSLARDWRAASPIGRPGFALDAWNARAVATRMLHWACAASLLRLDARDPDGAWLAEEIALHALFLRDNLELDLCGNHLLRDCTGLAFASALGGGPADAFRLLERELARQILADGCHLERAPMYHAIALEDLLELRMLLDGGAPAWLDGALARMAGFLEAIVHGDGEIPLLGDGWLGEVDTRSLLSDVRAQVTPLPPREPERESGLVALRRGALHLVLRAGPHAPDYQMGHAHADLLSFELSRGRERVVVDTGTSVYDAGAERQHLRSTAAHNTVAIDGAEQLEAWGSFRAGRRGRARCLARGGGPGLEWIWAAHDAYAFLPGRPAHHRLVALSDELVLVLDVVLGSGRHRIESRLLLHPSEGPVGAGEPAPARCTVALRALTGPCRPARAPLHERFGETREAAARLQTHDASLPWAGGWLLAFAAPPEELRADLLAGEAGLRFVAGDARHAIKGTFHPADPTGSGGVVIELARFGAGLGGSAT